MITKHKEINSQYLINNKPNIDNDKPNIDNDKKCIKCHKILASKQNLKKTFSNL